MQCKRRKEGKRKEKIGRERKKKRREEKEKIGLFHWRTNSRGLFSTKVILVELYWFIKLIESLYLFRK